VAVCCVCVPIATRMCLVQSARSLHAVLYGCNATPSPTPSLGIWGSEANEWSLHVPTDQVPWTALHGWQAELYGLSRRNAPEANSIGAG
jgi:hypothetical protein